MLGVCYYPEHWPETWWKEDARRMRELGISFVRIGEFAWSRLEPSRGDYQFDWLERAIDVLGDTGLKVVLGTPTATPPKWLMDEHPEIAPVDEQGRQRGFGSRRHYSFSPEVWWKESRRIVEKIAQHFGEHPALAGWQTDNEYGCHFTILSWGEEDLKAFRRWLRSRYQTTDQLNEAWGNVFWSMEVQSFDEISLPNLTVTEPSPAARFDFWRFQSDQVAAYNRMQCEIIRKHSPGRWITHNFMGFFNEFDHWDVGDDLDLASWDSYPIGFAESFLTSDEEKLRWAETSHPDIAPYHHDLYRAVGKGRFWVMEQQPGPVNWATWNPVPKPGMVRLWTWEALAHGADVVSYFRWRQAPFGQEQYHAGLNLPRTQELSPGGKEAGEVARELAKLGDLGEAAQAPVAIVYDYAAHWVAAVQPQGKDFRYYELVFRWYEAVRRLGLDVDFVRPGAPLDGYRLVLAPTLPLVSGTAAAAFAASDAVKLFGPRTGSKTGAMETPDNLAPGPLAEALGVRVIEVSTMRPGLEKPVTGKVAGKIERWAEHIESSGRLLSTFADGRPAFTAKGRNHYLAGWPDADLINAVMRHVVAEAGLETLDLPEHIRIRRRGAHIYAFNYGEADWHAPEGWTPMLGESVLKARQVGVYRIRDA